MLEDWCAKERRDPAEIELSCGVDTEGDNARPEVLGEHLRRRHEAVHCRCHRTGLRPRRSAELGGVARRQELRRSTRLSRRCVHSSVGQTDVGPHDEPEPKVLPAPPDLGIEPTPSSPHGASTCHEPTPRPPCREKLRPSASRRRRIRFAAVHALQCGADQKTSVGGARRIGSHQLHVTERRAEKGRSVQARRTNLGDMPRRPGVLDSSRLPSETRAAVLYATGVGRSAHQGASASAIMRPCRTTWCVGRGSFRSWWGIEQGQLGSIGCLEERAHSSRWERPIG